MVLEVKGLNQSGFSLLEVMIALTILALALSAVLTSESGSIASNIRTKEYNMAVWLARNILTESEHLYEGKSFSEIPKKETKSFTTPYERFKWNREIRDIKFPDFSIPTGKDDMGIPEPVRILLKSITKYLGDSLREMTVTVSWPRGKGEQKISVTTYLIDLKQEFNFGI